MGKFNGPLIGGAQVGRLLICDEGTLSNSERSTGIKIVKTTDICPKKPFHLSQIPSPPFYPDQTYSL